MSVLPKRPRTALLVIFSFCLAGCGPEDQRYPNSDQAIATNREQLTGSVRNSSYETTNQVFLLNIRVSEYAEAYLISWDRIGDEPIDGYIVYRNGVRITQILHGATASYVDLGSSEGERTYAVSVVWPDGSEGQRTTESYQ